MQRNVRERSRNVLNVFPVVIKLFFLFIYSCLFAVGATMEWRGNC